MLSVLTRKRPDQGEVSAYHQGAVHWFLLFWFGLIFGQTIVYRFVSQDTQRYAIETQAGSSSSFFSSVSLFLTLHLTPAVILFLFLVLMGLHGGFHWLALFRGIKPRRLWGYVLLQLLGIFCIATVAGADNPGYADDLALGLSLILVMEVFLLGKHLPMAWILGGCALVFGVLMQVFHLQAEMQPADQIDTFALFLKFAASIGGSTFLPCICASVMLSLTQTRAHQRDQQLLRELASAHEQLAVYAAQVQELTLTTERQRMARELHDTLAQGLVGLKMQLETIDALLEWKDVAQARGIVQQAMQRVRSALANARAAITDLRTKPGGGLSAAIAAEARHFSQMTGVPCTCSLTISLPDRHPEQVVRLVSEALTNISRHAHASRAWITSSNDQGDILLEIGDNGVGFDPGQVAAGHYGLAGLHERARCIGGQLHLSSERQVGTTLVLRLPCGEAGVA
jgi:NarL family two-component system sensor histidine kinase YdfH